MKKSFAVGVFHPDDLHYLHTISAGSPVELFRSPFVFLSSPHEPIDAPPGLEVTHELPTEVDGEKPAAAWIPFRFRCARRALNVGTNQTEYAVVSYAYDEASAIRSMLPYFVWMIDPNQSTTVRTFLVSLENTLHSDNKTLRVAPFLVPVDGVYGGAFNESVYQLALGN